MLLTIIRFLRGKKTYIIGTLMVLISLEHLIAGDTTLSQFLTSMSGDMGLNGLGLMALRAAVSKQG